MVPATDLLLFAGAALMMALSPGPNMVYLLSRSICQGRKAGVVSLLGVVAGFFAHLIAAAGGLAALFVAVPLAYEVLKWLGAAYLLHLAWQAVKPGARSALEARQLKDDRPAKLFWMGFLTNLLNPKAAVLYVSILPQFVSPEQGSILAQSLMLGMVQISVSFTVNLAIVLGASRMARWFGRHPRGAVVQRHVMGLTLAGLALRMALSRQGAG